MSDKLTQIINSKNLSRYTKLSMDTVREIAVELRLVRLSAIKHVKPDSQTISLIR